MNLILVIAFKLSERAPRRVKRLRGYILSLLTVKGETFEYGKFKKAA